MPLTTPTLETLLAHAPNKFALVNAVAKRANDLHAKKDLPVTPTIETANTNAVSVAMEEIAAGTLRVELGTDKT